MIRRQGSLARALGLTALVVACLPVARAAEPTDLASRAQRERLFTQGCASFRVGVEAHDQSAASTAFREAAAAWRALSLRAGIHNALLEMNIANAEVLSGDAPRAIAAFRRAMALDPRSVPIRDGLAAARRAAGTQALAPNADAASNDADADTGVRGTATRIAGTLARGATRTLSYLPTRPLMIASATLYVLAFAVWLMRRMELVRLPRWLAPGALVLSVLAAGPLIARDATARPEGVMIAPNVVARNGPGDVYDKAFQEPLRAGLEVVVVESRAGWTRIRLADGRSAWVPEGVLEPI